MEIISRKDAQALGLTHYFTGKPCGQGHIDKRYVQGTRCFSCGNQRGLKHRTNIWKHTASREELAAEKSARDAANASGETKYNSVIRCKHGHAGERYARSRACVACQAEKSKSQYHANPEKAGAERSARRLKNIDTERARDRKYRIENKERVQAGHTALRRKHRRDNPTFALKHRVRSLIANSIRLRGYKKNSKTEEILGCSIAQFKVHIERQFLKGMCWDNRDEWHIDHITPMSSAKTEDEVLALCRFTNLRPLWAKENIEKSDQVLYLI